MKITLKILSKVRLIRITVGLSITALVLFGLLSSASAQTLNNSSANSHLAVGLALSGGGARGIAHIGVIIALEENNIPIDLIAGTSMGSIVGGFYAAGYTGKEMQEIVNRIDWNSIFLQNPDPRLELISKRYGMMEPLMRFRFKKWEIYLPLGLMNGQRISELLFKLTAEANFAAQSNFDSLVVPYRAMAVDVTQAELLALHRGELAQAIHASMAIPLVFSPAIVDDRILIDGGVLNILPTDVAKEMGADVVIACDLEGLFPLGKEPKHFADVAIHTLDITIRELKKENVQLADVLIEPELGQHSAYDYTGLDSLIQLGYEATMAKMDDIKKLIPEAARTPGRSKRQLNTQLLNQAQIERIKVKGHDRVRLPVITGEFPLKKGDTFNLDAAFQGVKNIYATGLFENVWLELDPISENHVGVNIHVIEKYPRTIGFGVNYQTDEGISGFVQIVHFNFFGWGERFMPLLRVGELHKRAGLEIVNDRFFATPLTVHNGIYYERERPYIYNAEGKRIDHLVMDRVVAQFSLGVQPYRRLLFTSGFRGERVWLNQNQYLGIPTETLEHWSAFGELVFDNTDDRYFPNKGIRLLLSGESIVEFKRNTRPFTKFSGSMNYYFSPNKSNTLSLNLFAGTSVNGLPIYEQFRLGGRWQVPGYRLEELWGNQAFNMQLNYRFKFFKKLYFQTNFSVTNVNNGNQIELDNLIKGVSAGFIADSPIGPVELLYGQSDDERSQLYISVGYHF